jgi:hypothetical protein
MTHFSMTRVKARLQVVLAHAGDVFPASITIVPMGGIDRQFMRPRGMASGLGQRLWHCGRAKAWNKKGTHASGQGSRLQTAFKGSRPPL